jgi:hypothetical protein
MTGTGTDFNSSVQVTADSEQASVSRSQMGRLVHYNRASVYGKALHSMMHSYSRPTELLYIEALLLYCNFKVWDVISTYTLTTPNETD